MSLEGSGSMLSGRRSPRLRVLLLAFALLTSLQYLSLCEGYEAAVFSAHTHPRAPYFGYFSDRDDSSLLRNLLAESARGLLKPLQPVLRAGFFRCDPQWARSLYFAMHLDSLEPLAAAHTRVLFLAWTAINSLVWVLGLSLGGALVIRGVAAVMEKRRSPGPARAGHRIRGNESQ